MSTGNDTGTLECNGGTKLDLAAIQTETRNPRSSDIDKVSTQELCRIIIVEDSTIPSVIQKCIPTIAQAIDVLAEKVRNGGRIFYIGAGTSGRLGVLDASEIPPTYSAPPSQFVGLIAGGDVALRSAIEGAEDDFEAAAKDLEAKGLNGEQDGLIGIAASGRTPYVLGGMAWAKRKGCVTVGVACSAPSSMSKSGDVEFMVEAVTGPEVVTGSTRMKAGTATKMVLNMISTGVMIKIGKTYGNIMVDVKPTNVKLKQRAKGILREICGERCPASDDALDVTLEACGRSVKLAAVATWFNIPVADAQQCLQEASGILTNALQPPKKANEHRSRTFSLCVDGGGSKCHAVIVSYDELTHETLESQGNAGPCNATEIGVDAAVSHILLAVGKAIETHVLGADVVEVGFKSVWVAVAGSDRGGLKDKMYKCLRDRIQLGLQGLLHITNDIELVAMNKFHQVDEQDQDVVDHVLVLVAGTGAVATTYCRKQGQLRRVDRSGGWGALLGDDGSGFDVGRQAIRLTLEDLESRKRLADETDDYEVVSQDDPLSQTILDHFSPVDGTPATDLLSAVIMPNAGDVQAASETKRRIASCAKVVINMTTESSRARKIVDSALSSLLTLVENLLEPADVSPGRSALVLAGGMMMSNHIRQEFEGRLLASGFKFWQVGNSELPAHEGARYLAKIHRSEQ